MEISKLIENVDKFEVDLPFKPLIHYAEELFTVGFDTMKNDSLNLKKFSTNGWQVDFWWIIQREDKKYMLSGSVFYGNLKLAVYEDEEDEDYI